ncbi:hypothetical protein AB0H88_23055 [Nonomuraea sp. NPDC050680]|uniref:hypothetical protein n=1 Tax=Nonomuraea sp. NPDC050680 TaxID=3154630 RepID=UPI0033FEC1AA
MIERGALVVLGSALVAALALPQGFTAVAPVTRTGAMALSARLNPCDDKGQGCPKGYSDGYANGVRCQPSRPGKHPASGQPDYRLGYKVGWAVGRKHAGCGGGDSSGRAQLRQQGKRRGAADAATFHRCVKRHFQGRSKLFKHGYKAANPHC